MLFGSRTVMTRVGSLSVSVAFFCSRSLTSHFLDLLELLALLERGQVFEARERAADDAIHAQDLAEERDPVGLLIHRAGWRFAEFVGTSPSIG